MRQKFEAQCMLVKWKNMMEKKTGRKIKELIIDNVENNRKQFLKLGQNTYISTHFINCLLYTSPSPRDS